MTKQWDYPGNFLNNFEIPRRSLISNMFCFAVRRGADSIEEILSVVNSDASKRVENEDYDSPVAESLFTLLDLTASGEADDFAGFILRRENLSHEEKQRLKKQANSQYAEQAMQTKPPTDKQLNLLKSKGVETIPNDRYEASKLIGELLRK